MNYSYPYYDDCLSLLHNIFGEEGSDLDNNHAITLKNPLNEVLIRNT